MMFTSPLPMAKPSWEFTQVTWMNVGLRQVDANL